MGARVRGYSSDHAGLAPAGSPKWPIPQSPTRGRPPTIPAIKKLVVAMAKGNPGWGHRRIQGELARVGHTIAHSTVWEILKLAGVDPARQTA